MPGLGEAVHWYLTGFLIPSDTPFEQRCDDEEHDSSDETPEVAGLAEESAEERRAEKRGSSFWTRPPNGGQQRGVR